MKCVNFVRILLCASASKLTVRHIGIFTTARYFCAGCRDRTSSVLNYTNPVDLGYGPTWTSCTFHQYILIGDVEIDFLRRIREPRNRYFILNETVEYKNLHGSIRTTFHKLTANHCRYY